MPILTHADVAHRISLLPPHQQQDALARYRRAYPHPPPMQRTPDDEALYQACRWDRERFAREFFPHITEHSFNKVHLDAYARYAQRRGSRGHLDATAAPRGFSKTTGCATLGILHDCCYVTEKFIVYLTNRAEHADEKVRDMRDELESNEKLIRVYGDQVGAIWNQADFTTANGVRVLAAGRQTQVRGITKRMQRPTKVVIDDTEHPDHVLNEEQREKTWNWLTKDVLKLGSPTSNFELWGTILHPDSMLARALKTPGWTTQLYQAVTQFADPSSLPLWQEWRDIFTDISNAQHQEDARAFFEAHEEAMLLGVEVLWPDRKPYYDLMVTRLREGESAFWQELMNQPQADSRYLFDMESAAYCRLMPEGLIRAGGTYVPYLTINEIAAFVDPTPDKKDVRGTDYAACAVVMKDQMGYCYLVDMYLKQEASTAKQIDGIVDVLWKWKVPLLGVESNGFASLLASALRDAIAQRAHEEGTHWNVDLVPVVHTRNKVLRIRTLEPMVENGWLQFAATLPPECIRQFAEFLPIDDAGHDDAPDAVEGAVRTVKGLYDRRSPY